MQLVLVDNNLERMNIISSELMHAGMLKVFCVNAESDSATLPTGADLVIVVASQTHENIKAQIKKYVNKQIIITLDLANELELDNEFVMLIDGDKASTTNTKHIINSAKGIYYRYLLNLGKTAKSNRNLRKLEKYAISAVPVLISGETGTGKEVVARYIHYSSSFKDGEFVALNCAAIPETMFEAILFGHEKGAFTNAIQTYIGKIEQANGGTLLLDEISEMPLPMQAKLLRVIQEKEIEKIGSNELVKVDFRLVATTNKDLKELVKDGKFRNDLFYRLNVALYEPTPLRERKSDIPQIAEYLLKYHAKNTGITDIKFDNNGINQLVTHDWPGNIRELENVIQKALILDQDSIISSDDIDIENIEMDATDVKSMTPLQESEAMMIMDILKKVSGKRDLAAKILNISPRTLRYKISKLKENGFQIP